MEIAAPLLLRLLEFAESRGVSGHELRKLLPDPEVDLCQDQGKVKADDYLQVLKTLDTQLGDPEMGISFGKFLNLSALGLIFQISQAAQSIGQAILLLENYLPVNFSLISLRRSGKGEELSFQLESTVADKRLRKLILDSTACFIFREFALMADRNSVDMEVPEGAAALFSHALRAEISGGQAYRFRFPEDQAALPLNRRHLHAIEVLLPKYLQMTSVGEAGTFSGKVRNMILNLCQPELPELSEVIGQFAMSERTFQRRLTEEGSSFREISNGLKAELSRYLREGNRMKTKDIAYILGYSGPAAYLHAASRW